MLGLLIVITLFLGSRAQDAFNNSNITSHGYPAEEHYVTTKDGYILGLQRIPYGKNSGNSTSNRKVVFLMHGLLAGSDYFTYLGPDYGMAYIFADAGYDVWMGNTRGNSHSRKHVSLNADKDSRQFFNYTVEDLALFDLPAMVDYILATTNLDELHYVAHSQGGSLFFILNSLNSSYHSKFTSAHLLAGVGYNHNFPNKNVKVLSNAIDVLYSLCLLVGYVELKPSSTLTSVLIESLVNSTVPGEIIVGASVKQAVHFSQNFRDGTFRKWNYGAVTNLFKYGSASPPSYNLSNINVNITLHYGPNDVTQSEEDVLAMVEAMPNARARKVPRDDFNHMDFIINKNSKELVTDYIIETFKND